MVLKFLDYWIMVQMTLELVLMVLILIFLAKIKRLDGLMKSPSLNKQPKEVAGAHKEEVLGTDVGNGLENVLAQLNQRSAMIQQQMSQLESRMEKIEPNFLPEADSASLRSKVEHLFQRGISPDEIARKLGMNLAEVKVALDLSRVQAR